MESEELLDAITLSEKRRRILLLLREGPKTLSDLRGYFNVTSPEIIPQIRIMEQKRLLRQVGREYVLTEIGEIVADSFNRLLKTLSIFEKHEAFWERYKLSGIPKEFRQRIYELGNYKIVRSDPTEIFEPHKEFMKNLLSSRIIKGVSPIFHPEYPQAFLSLAKRGGGKTSLILTKNVFERVLREYKGTLEKFLKLKDTILMVSDEKIEVAFTVTERFLSLGLFLKDGNYDTHNDIVSLDKSAIKWGEDLFNHYRRHATQISVL